jgi:hypothetical protein
MGFLPISNTIRYKDLGGRYQNNCKKNLHFGNVRLYWNWDGETGMSRIEGNQRSARRASLAVLSRSAGLGALPVYTVPGSTFGRPLFTTPAAPVAALQKDNTTSPPTGQLSKAQVRKANAKEYQTNYYLTHLDEHREAARKYSRTHQIRGTYHAMIRRCCNPNAKEFHYYGGRGIKVCARWLDPVNGFNHFQSDMGPRPSPQHTLERKKNDGNYSQFNCVWATMKEQRRNTRGNCYLDYGGEHLCLSAWAEKLGLDHQVLRYRVRKGWPAWRVIETPVKTTAERLIAYRGQQLRIIEWAKKLGMKYETLYGRLQNGWSVKRAFETPVGEVRIARSHDNRFIRHEGQYLSEVEWAKTLGMKVSTFQSRIDSGWSMTHIISTPVRVGRRA